MIGVSFSLCCFPGSLSIGSDKSVIILETHIRPQKSTLIRANNVCFSICIFWPHFSFVENSNYLRCPNFVNIAVWIVNERTMQAHDIEIVLY